MASSTSRQVRRSSQFAPRHSDTRKERMSPESVYSTPPAKASSKSGQYLTVMCAVENRCIWSLLSMLGYDAHIKRRACQLRGLRRIQYPPREFQPQTQYYRLQSEDAQQGC